MFKSVRIQLSLYLIIALSLNACKSEYQKVLKGNDLPKKYEMAKKYYNDKDYFRAFQLFDELVNVYRGSEDAEKIYYYYAYSHYGLKDMISARFHFQNFADTYPRSALAEECRYMAAYCYYLDSPEYTLDQDNTYKAIEAMQLFINMHPKSERVAESNIIIDRLREKLEAKSYSNAKLYFNIGDYKSAIYAIKNSLLDFPDSKYREEMMFLSIKSAYLYADMSIDSKKSERFLESMEYYQTFVDSYATSKYLKDAQSIFNNCIAKIEQIKKLSN